MANKFFSTDSYRGVKTNKLSKFLLVLFLVIVPMVVFWILFGQINVLGLNWIVPIGGKFWQNQSLVDQLIKADPTASTWAETGWFVFGSIQPDRIKAYNAIGINLSQPLFNPLILAPTLGLLGLDIIIFVLLSLFVRNIYIDIFPMSISSWFGLFLLIITGLIPIKESYAIPVMIVCIVLGWIGTLIPLNILFNKIIIDSKHADIYYEKLLRETREEILLKDESLLPKKPKSDDTTFIDVKE